MNKIEITNTKDEIVEIIKREIISGHITNEDNITQTFIAEKFGLSRMPIREAFNVLVQEGFLIKKNNRKLDVIEITTTTLDTYGKLLTSVEIELLHNLWQTKEKRQDVLAQLFDLISTASDADKVLAFHTYLADMQNDFYIGQLHKNILNGFFMFSLRNCTNDYSYVANKIEELLKALVKTNDFDRQSAYDTLLLANQSVVSKIQKDKE